MAIVSDGLSVDRLINEFLWPPAKFTINRNIVCVVERNFSLVVLLIVKKNYNRQHTVIKSFESGCISFTAAEPHKMKNRRSYVHNKYVVVLVMCKFTYDSYNCILCLACVLLLAINKSDHWSNRLLSAPKNTHIASIFLFKWISPRTQWNRQQQFLIGTKRPHMRNIRNFDCVFYLCICRTFGFNFNAD